MTTVADDRRAEPGLEPGLRERKKQQTWSAIHEAAFQLVDEHGLEGTTIEQICQHADVSSRTFFNYFPSKMAAALGLTAEPIDEESVERFRSATGSLVDALCAAVARGGQFASRQARLKGLVTRHPELIPTLTSTMAATRGRFVALAAERAASPADAELAVTLVFAALTLTVHSDLESELPSGERLRATVDSLTRVRGVMLTPARP
jgi:AcrR family transcriptional regulator